MAGRFHQRRSRLALAAAKFPLWLNELRRKEVTDRVRKDPRSQGETLFGLEVNAAFERIGGGQANFVAQNGDLSPDDMALLYAYLNQKGHLEELVTAFRLLGAKGMPENPIVVDVGCGPYTGGLALAAALGGKPCFDYIGIDEADSMRQLAAHLACSELVPARVTTRWATDISSVDWPHAPGWREVIVIVSYLFASRTLDVERMFEDLQLLLSRFGRGGVTLLYTNSAKETPNSKYPGFRTRLKEAGFQVYSDDQGEITVERDGRTKVRKLYYALFRRDPLRQMPLGD